MNSIIPAAGAILLKQSVTLNDFEVLLLKRNPELKVHGGKWVFPGGKVDKVDLEVLALNSIDSPLTILPTLNQEDST